MHSGHQRCYVCPAGTYMDEQEHRHAECKACPSGKYQDKIESVTCIDHVVCQPGQLLSVAPTASTDRVCEGCDRETYTDTENAGECTDWKLCGPGEYVSKFGWVNDARSRR